jgi:hypothetical protein
MNQLEGFSTDLNLVVQLHKSIYEIKKASQVWNATFNAFLSTYKLIPNVADPCIYYSAGSPPILTTLFVDDGIFCYVDANKRSATMQYMAEHVETTQQPVNQYMWDFALLKTDLIHFFTLIKHVILIAFLRTTNFWILIMLQFQLILTFSIRS